MTKEISDYFEGSEGKFVLTDRMMREADGVTLNRVFEKIWNYAKENNIHLQISESSPLDRTRTIKWRKN